MFRRSLVTLPLILSFAFGGTVNGTVKNSANGKSIPNANIYIVETKQGTVTDPYGFFEIDLPNGSHTIQITNIGFKSYSSEITVAGQPVKLNVELESTILEFGEISVEGLFSTRLGYESVDILSGDQIKSMEKESVSDVLRMLPGVDVQFAHANGRNANLSIRGSSDYKPGGYNNRVLLLLDGFPIQIPNSGAPDWNSLPLESIQRIEVDNSPASAQYGHNSMGGVINLITDYIGRDQATILKIGGGTFSTAETSISHHLTKENWIFGFNGKGRISEGHRFNSDDKTGRIRSFLKYADRKGRTYRLSHIVSHSDNGHPGFASTPSWRRSERTSHYLQGHGFYPITEGISMSHSLFLNKFNTRYYDKDSVPSDKEEGDRLYDDLAVGIRSEMLITKWERWIILAGSDVDWSQSDVTVFNPIYNSPSQFSWGTFVQSKYSIGNGWSMGTGLRYDYRESDPGNNFTKRQFTNWSPKLNFMYALKGKRAFTMAYSEGFRAPSLSELYLKHTSSYGLTQQGNPNVLPERVRAIEFSYDHPHSESWQWGVATFYNKYENMIDFVYSLPVKAVNREGVTGKGLEIQSNWHPTESMSFSSQFEFLDMEDRGGDPILYRSKYKGNISVTLNTNIVDLRVSSRFWSEQQYDDFLSHDYKMVEDKIIFPLGILPAQAIPEMVVSKQIRSYRVSFKISNLLDAEYALIQDYPMPGRTWHGTLTKSL